MTEAAKHTHLMPCPVCGSGFLMGQEPADNHPVAGKFYIYHDYGPIGSEARKCPIEVPRHFETADEATTAWNRRAAEETQSAALRAATNELSRLLFNEPSETTHKVIEVVDAALSKAEGRS